MTVRTSYSSKLKSDLVFLWNTRSFWPCDNKLLCGLVISCHADDAIMHLACLVDPFNCLISKDLVESPFGPLHYNLSIRKLCMELSSPGFYVCKVNWPPSCIVCVVIYCEPWQHRSECFYVLHPVATPLSSDEVQQDLNHAHISWPQHEFWIIRVRLVKLLHEGFLTTKCIW